MFAPSHYGMNNITRFGKVRYHFDQLDSTNLFAHQLVAKGAPRAGTIVATDNQTAGRGQFGRKWISEPKLAFTASFIVFPHFLPSAHLTYLSFCIAVSTAAAVSAFVEPETVRIKWPNDIYLKDKKVAGILIENSILSSGNIGSSILGIGINLGQTLFAPETKNATSIASQTDQKAPSFAEMETVLCAQLERDYALLEAGRLEQLLARYNGLLYGRNKSLVFEQTADNQIFIGEPLQVDSAGQLHIKGTDGRVTAWTHGSIQLVNTHIV
jgi:BirA family transcriptional regulator, biotin operon repressor / biotin---[acetyl-CoA-carboxylase] ligase